MIVHKLNCPACGHSDPSKPTYEENSNLPIRWFDDDGRCRECHVHPLEHERDELLERVKVLYDGLHALLVIREEKDEQIKMLYDLASKATSDPATLVRVYPVLLSEPIQTFEVPPSASSVLDICTFASKVAKETACAGISFEICGMTFEFPYPCGEPEDMARAVELIQDRVPEPARHANADFIAWATPERIKYIIDDRNRLKEDIEEVKTLLLDGYNIMCNQVYPKRNNAQWEWFRQVQRTIKKDKNG